MRHRFSVKQLLMWVQSGCAAFRLPELYCLVKAVIFSTLVIFSLTFSTAVSHAQTTEFELPGLSDATDNEAEERMLLEAEELNYDLDNDSVTATGNVQIYYKGYTLQAEVVRLDQRNARLIADGNVRLTEPDGNVVLAQSLNLSDDFREGFVKSLRVESSLRTRFAAESAERVDEDITVFNKGVYTACSRCVSNPDKPPTWQIKARTITHNRKTKTISYEKAKLEFWGVPVLYLPRFSHPDPTVKRKSGFLSPEFVVDDDLGIGATVRHFWTISPSMDFLTSISAFRRQGVLARGEFRQRTENGQYRISGGGIIQQDPSAFSGTSGAVSERGYLKSSGRFEITDRWNWGWDGLVMSDRSFQNDYGLSDADETYNSQLFLTGQGDRSYFDLRAHYFNIQREDNATAGNALINAGTQTQLQNKQPIVHPSLSYSRVLNNPVFGGEVSLDFDTVTVSRITTDKIDFINATTPDRYLGIKGAHGRMTGQVQWRRNIVNSFGQIIKPFASLRADAFLVGEGDSTVPGLVERRLVARAMPTVGIEASWPLLVRNSWGSQVLEPIAQIIARPSEARIGHVPNEDAHSLVFDDSNLFQHDKFSGFDRAEGGTRLNYGFKYRATTEFGHLNALVGQSVHLAGRNSFTQTGLVNAGANSGLDKRWSDFVAGAYLDTGRGFQLSAKTRFDSNALSLNRAEVRGTLLSGPMLASATYTYLKEQPLLGIPVDREEMLLSATTRLNESWRMFGSLRYDMRGNSFIRDSVGLAFDDESLTASVTISEDRSRNDGDAVDRTVYFRLGLRTLGDTGFKTNVDGN